MIAIPFLSSPVTTAQDSLDGDTLVVCVAAHPDDIEIAASGSLYKDTIGNNPIMWLVATDGGADLDEYNYESDVSRGWITQDGQFNCTWEAPDGSNITRSFYSADLAKKRCGGYFEGLNWTDEAASHSSPFGVAYDWGTRVSGIVDAEIERIQLGYFVPSDPAKRVAYPDGGLELAENAFRDSIAANLASEINKSVESNGYQKDLIKIYSHAPAEVSTNSDEHPDHKVVGDAVRQAIEILLESCGFGQIEAKWFTVYNPINPREGYVRVEEDISLQQAQKSDLAKLCWETANVYVKHINYTWTEFPINPGMYEYSVVRNYTTITVPDDYPSIQQAIDNAIAGDVILVRNGTYYENITVNKCLSLIGLNGTQQPVIDAGGAAVVAKISADGVLLAGFNVTNSSWGDSYGDHHLGGGIQIFGASECLIANNTVYNNLACGISLVNANNNTVANNTCVKNEVGIRLWSWSPQTTNCNVINNNTCSENLKDGISIWSYVYNTLTTNYNNITNNFISRNGLPTIYGQGIYIGKSNEDIISGNTIFSNYRGLTLDSALNCRIFHNDFIMNNQPVRVWDESGAGASVNQLDNGYPSGGNYYSDYNGEDVKSGPNQNITGSDGIGDTPQIFNSDNQDRYPLMVKRGTFEPTYIQVNFTDSFRDNSGAALYTKPTAFQLLLPNGTVSSSLEPGKYTIHTGTTRLLSVTWKGTEVKPDIIATFDAADGNPTINCKIYNLTIAPVFYNFTGDQNETVIPSSWSIRFPNSTELTVSSSVTYPQTQTGSYSIFNVVLDEVNFTSVWVSLSLITDTVWSPQIGLFKTDSNQTFIFDSNSTLAKADFDANKNVLSFTAAGPDGTIGYTNMTFAESLTIKPEGIIVCQDGNQISYTLTQMNDTWLLSFNYNHSTHNFEIDFSARSLAVEGATAWYWVSNTTVNSVTVGDVDGDGQKETVTGGSFYDGTRNVAQLVVWNSTTLEPKQLTTWYWTGNTSINSVALGDVDGDGDVEIVTGGYYFDGERDVAQLVVWNGSSLAVEGVKTWYWINNTVVNSVALGDVNDDGQTEIVTGGYFNDDTRNVAQLVVWTGTDLSVDSLTTWYWANGTVINSVAIGDVDGDEQTEIVTGGTFNDDTRDVAQLVVWNGSDLTVDRLTAWYWVADTAINSVAVADVDADGQTEIVTGGYFNDGTKKRAQLVVWTGSALAVDRLTSWYWINNTEINSIALGDVGYDGQVDVVTGGYYNDGECNVAQIVAWSGSSLAAENIRTWYWVSDTVINSVCLSDLNGDWTAEIVTGGGYHDGSRWNAQLTVWGMR